MCIGVLEWIRREFIDIPGEKAYEALLLHILLLKEMKCMRMPALPKDKSEPKRSYIQLLKEMLFKSKKKQPFIKVPERK